MTSELTRYDPEVSGEPGKEFPLMQPVFDGQFVRYSQASDRIAELEAEVERLKAIVDKLPKTADGVPVGIGDVVWWLHSGIAHECAVTGIDDLNRVAIARLPRDSDQSSSIRHSLYSTREAAIAASKEQDDA